MDGWIYRQKERQIILQIDRLKDRWIDRNINGQIDRWKARWMDRQKYKWVD